MKLSHCKTFAFIAITLCVALASYASENGDMKIDQHLSEIDTTEEASSKKRYYSFGLTYGNNSSFLGRYQTKTLPFYSLDASYISKTGFWISGVAYEIPNTTSVIDEIDLMTGWNVNLSKRLDASVYYTQYFFSTDSELLKSTVGNSVSAALGLDWTYLYSRLTSSYTFGDASDIFFVLDNSRYFEFPSIFGANDYISLDPRVSVIAGTQSFAETHYIREGIISPAPVTSAPTTGTPTGGGPPTSGGSTGGTTTTTTSESVSTSFGILSYEVGLPIVYSTGGLDVELSIRYTIPVNIPESVSLSPQLFFTASLIYTIAGKK